MRLLDGICVVFVALLFLSSLHRSECFKVEGVRRVTPSLDKSGWRTLETEDGSEQAERKSDPSMANDQPSTSMTTTTTITKQQQQLAGEKNKKLIEWDDDDLNEFIQNIRDREKSGESLQDLDLQPFKALSRTATGSRPSARKSKPGSSKFNRLVYHGQLKQNATTIKLHDGLKIQIDTHRPLAIYRRSKQQQDDAANRPQSIPGQPASSTRWSVESPPRTQTMTSAPTVELMRPMSSDWRPIVFAAGATTRSRRSGRVSNQAKLMMTDVELPKVDVLAAKIEWNNATNNAGNKFRWKPIKADKSSSSEDELEQKTKLRKDNRKLDNEVVYGKKSGDESVSYQVRASMRNARIEEPFDDEDGVIVLRGKPDNDDSSSSGQQHRLPSRGGGAKDSNEPKKSTISSAKTKWMPVEQLSSTRDASATTPTDNLAMTTTTAPITTTTPTTSSSVASNGSIELAAHRSASDLNYIYSSQPDRETLGARSNYNPSANSYYSNYLIQPTAPAAVQPMASLTIAEQPVSSAIIDTTSGQTPEMIADKVPDPVSNGAPAYDGYSLPQTSVAAFQPAQPLPQRQPSISQSYGYDYLPRAVQQPSRAIVAQLPARAPQVVKQEHHYHYYNQQQQHQRDQQAERQSSSQQQQPASQIIREIQPLLISQPILQQQQQQQQPTTTTTTTPAPLQIIREIIRETPMQPTQQFSRVVQLPQPVPVPAIRELEPATYQTYVADNPAQRIIRQLVSSGLPSVSMRMPQLPPIRLPALQLPVRLASPSVASNAAPVTRQTGSFVIPPMPKKTTTYLTETQAMPTHTTIMHTTQFTPATRTTVFTTDHDTSSSRALPATNSYKAK